MKFYLQWYERLPSTNTFLKERLKIDPDLSSGTVAAAREQTQGRGRREREWLSAGSENLTFSILLRGRFDPRRLPSASMAAAAAVAALLREEGILPVLKWPNDVLAGGKKICGILSEGVADGVIIGIGLNVNLQDTEPIDQPATSVRLETGRRREVEALLERLLPHLSSRLDRWVCGGFSAIRDEWEGGGAKAGQPVSVRDGGNIRTGVFAGFGENGELLLEYKTGRISAVWAGDVFL